MNSFIISGTFALVFLCIFLLVKAVKIIIAVLKILAVILTCITRRSRKSLSNKSGIKYTRRASYSFPSAADIGRQGEDDLCEKLSRIEPSGRILRNLYVPFSNGFVTEIDAVMLTSHGIYVFEYKNYRCNMFIPENEDSFWLRSDFAGSSAHEVYSPVRQNRTHMAALEYVLGCLSGTRGIERYLTSYVVLGDECRIRTGKPSFDNSKVLNLSELNILESAGGTLIPDCTLMLLETMLGRYQKGTAKA